MKYTKIIIKGRIPSKKNELVIAGGSSKKWITPSAKYNRWEKEQIEQIRANQNVKPLNPPYQMNIKFYAPDLHAADLSNKLESIQDMLVACGVIEDDNWFVLSDINMKFSTVDKDNPRAEIEIYSEVEESFDLWNQVPVNKKSLRFSGISVE